MTREVAGEKVLLLVGGVVGVDEGGGGRRLVVVLVVVLVGFALVVRQDGVGRVLTAGGDVVAADDPGGECDRKYGICFRTESEL